VQRHIHKFREEPGTNANNPEAWICFSGVCSFDVFSIDQDLVYSAELKPSEVLLVEVGGNAINKVSSDFKFIEVKSGPFTGRNWEYF
jgi:hypothetical protein